MKPILCASSFALLVACSSSESSTDIRASGGTSASAGSGAIGGSDSGAGGGTTGGSAPGTGGSGASDPACIGWASVSPGTTGGGSEPIIDVTSLSSFGSDAAGTTPRVLRLTQSMTGSVAIGSNKTITAAPGVVFTGHFELSQSSNVILRNLKIVGYNCTTDLETAGDCSSGEDAISVINNAHHVCFDHCDISDGSDGNLDITQGADYVTIGWTKFSYSGRRSGGHQFSNLIGASDTSTVDTGHLRVTIHHSWWADNVHERMPRVRFGQVHLFDNLYTATGDNYCVGAGFSCNIRLENNVFIGVQHPINTADYSNGASIAASFGNVYTNSTGSRADLNASGVFTPPYTYQLDAANTVEAAVRSGAGVR